MTSDLHHPTNEMIEAVGLAIRKALSPHPVAFGVWTYYAAENVIAALAGMLPPVAEVSDEALAEIYDTAFNAAVPDDPEWEDGDYDSTTHIAHLAGVRAVRAALATASQDGGS